MTGRPLVSGIIIFLNAEKFIQEAIQSVFAQTYDNWELILVNDGSTDGSTDIALQYIEQYPSRVRYVEHHGQQNRGMSASRNLGLCNAMGEYIAFLDADDIWLPHKLERQIKILETNRGAAAVFSPWQEWLSWREKAEEQDLLQDLRVEPDSLIQSAQLVPFWLEGDSAIPGHCGTMWRRNALFEVSGFEESFRDYYEDLVLLIKVHLKAPVFVTGECLSKYRQHRGSTSAILENAGKDRLAKLTFYDWLEDYLVRKRIKDREIWKVLQKQLFPYRHPTLHHLLRYVRYSVSQIKSFLRLIARKVLPNRAYHWLKTQRQCLGVW